MNFEFGAAGDLYRDHVHPRVLFGPDDIPALRMRAKRGNGRKIMEHLRRKAGYISDWVFESGDLPKIIANWNITSTGKETLLFLGLIDTAMVALLDENERATEAVRRVLTCAPEARKIGQTGIRRLGYSVGYNMAYAYDIIAPRLSPRDRRLFTQWAVNECIRSLIRSAGDRYYLSAGGNLTLLAVVSALSNVLTIEGDPGVPPLAKEKRLLLSYLEATLNTAFNPDGYPEEDIGYGTIFGGLLAFIVEPLKRAGIYNAYRDCSGYARFSRAILHFVQPWGGRLSNTGDSGTSFLNREFVLARQAAETGDPALLWLLGSLKQMWALGAPTAADQHWDGEVELRKGYYVPISAASLLFADRFTKAVPPGKSRIPTSFCDYTRGIVSFRGGWEKDDTFVVFDGSQRCPAAQGHAHASCGHFSVSALGEYFSVDTGRYNIEQNCHSVTLIDGKSGRSTDGEWVAAHHAGVLAGYRPDAFVDYASVDSSLQHNCFWARRHLGLVKGTGMPAYVWVVDDINKNNAWAEHWWQLQTSPENRFKLYRNRATVIGWRHGNLMDVHFVLPSSREYPEPHRIIDIVQDVAVPSSFKYIRDPKSHVKNFERPSDMLHRSVFVRPRLLVKIGGLNGRFMSIMLPRGRGTAPASVRRLKSLPGSLAVSVASGNVEDTIIFAFEHNLLEAGDARERGLWCVIRRRHPGGAVIGRAVCETPCSSARTYRQAV